jgi:hypothetical protein
LLLAGFALPALAAGQAGYIPGSAPVTTVQQPANVTAGTFEQIPASAFDQVTVEQLEQALTAKHRLRDKEVAQQLSDLQLSQRLSTSRLERLKAGLPGEKARLALLALADASAFLDLPAKDLLPNAAPDAATQGQILSRAADFVISTLPRMPDFFAARTTTRFEDWKVAKLITGSILVPNQSFHLVDKLSTPVTYRNGREVLEAPGEKKIGSRVSSTTGLINWGVFGPLLGVVMADVLNGKVGWGHWEQGPAGPLAVFRYTVPEGRSNYDVRYCCFRSENGEMREFEAIPAYHGELAIDPASGAVLRLVLKTDLQPALPMERNDVLVEYAPVEIGGKTYICPVKSISITKTEALMFHGYAFWVNKKGNPDCSVDCKLKQTETVSEPKVTALNDVVFDSYHLFRGEVRMLPADSSAPEENAPASVPAAAPETAPKR